MLVEFNITNFRSIKEKVTLSMVAAKTKEEEHPENTFEVEGRNLRLLKSAVIYGANASGKSQIIKAFSFMCNFVISSITGLTPDGYIFGVVPFKLSSTTLNQPSSFEVTFIQDSESYTYGFSLTSKQIDKEWLYASRKNRQRLLFERDSSSNDEYQFGDSWKGEKKPLEERTRLNVLFLSVAHHFNNQDVQPVIRWFAEKCKWILDDSPLHNELNHTLELIIGSDRFKLYCEKMLKLADMGIEGIDIRYYPPGQDPSLLRLSEKDRARVHAKIKDTSVLRLSTKHKFEEGSNENESSLFDPFTEESTGTKKFLSLLGPWYDTLNNGYVLFIDEFERSLHPLLSRFLIQSLHDYPVKQDFPQLVFTSHDAELLNSDLFRRDQIWFTEKTEDGSTKLYSLWDMEPKPRISENFRKYYLRGRYGAIPFIEDHIEIIDEKKK